MSVYDSQECVFTPLPYHNKKAGFGFAADVAENPLSFDYCIIIWGSTYKTNLRRLVYLQKRVIRIISKSTFDSNSDLIFKELELLKLSDVRQLELGKLMFSFNRFLLPSKFNNYFSLNKQVHSYATRYANDFHLPFCRTNLRKFSVSF